MLMQNQLEVNAQRLTCLDKLTAALPGVMVHESAKWNAVDAQGALSMKIKRLMALGIALRASGWVHAVLELRVQDAARSD